MPPAAFARLAPLLLALGCAASPAGPATAPPAGDPLLEQFPDLDDALPMDPDVRTGTLDNGLRWYIEPKTEPPARAELRLVVKAGSLHEDDDQLGLAHFVEHMAFNGTEHFAGNELIAYLESLGSKFGAHLNAYTSFDRTVYKLHVPTDDDEAFGQAFVVLRDWAGGLAFDPEEIEKERGVVLEEWRRSLGVSARTRDRTVPWLYAGARHVDRLPIGTEDSLTGFDPDAARRFYADWYRPDLMAVIASGDFDVDSVQARIEAMFSDLATPPDARERVEHPIPMHDEPIYGVYADPEQSYSIVQVLIKRTKTYGPTRRDYRDVLVSRVVQEALRERLGALTRDPAAGVLYAGPNAGRWSPTTVIRGFYAVTPEGGVEQGLEAVLTELERARRHGFSDGELERARASVLRQMETFFNERETEKSSAAVGELLRNFMDGETVPGSDLEWAMAQAYVPTITAAEANALASAWIEPPSRVVFSLVPEGDGVITVAQLQAAEARVAAKEIAPPADEDLDQPLVAEAPVPGSVLERREIEAVGVTEWTLSNGVTVLLKPTDFKDDEIQISAWQAGGTSRIADDAWRSARQASAIASQSGVGPYDADQLARFLAGRKVRIRPYAGNLYSGFSGSTSPEDLDLALQLAHAWLTSARFSEDGFAVSLQRGKSSAQNRLARPDTVAGDAFNRLLYGDHERRRPWTVESYDAVERAAAEAFWRAEFADLSGLTVALVGAIDLEAVEPAVTAWLGSLPAGEGGKAWADEGIRLAEGVHDEVVRAGTEPKAKVRFRISGDFESTPERRHALSALTDLLQMRLREVLREDKGGVYSVGVRGPSTWAPVPTYGLSVTFGCDPERVEELTEAMREVLVEVRDTVPDADYVTRVQETRESAQEERLRTNRYWIGALRANRQRGEPPEALPLYWGLDAELTAEGIAESAQRWIDLDRTVTVVLLPEEGVTEASTD